MKVKTDEEMVRRMKGVCAETEVFASTGFTSENPTSKNPHEISLSKFLRNRAQPVSQGYVTLRNGQVVKEATLERFMREHTK